MNRSLPVLLLLVACATPHGASEGDLTALSGLDKVWIYTLGLE